MLLFPALCPVVPVYAANIYWNAATGKWETDTNWSPVQVPGISDDVTIDNNGTAQVDSTTGTAPTHSLFVGYNYNQAGTLELTGGGRVTASYAITLGSGNNSVGTVTIDGIGSVLQSNGNLTVGYSGTGVLKLTNGGTATAIGIFLGSTTGSFGTSHGIITVDGINSLLSAGDALSVGAVGNGTLELTNSGKATAKGNISIGDLAGSTGTVTVANSGSVLESTGGYLTVGNYGIGELHLTDSGKATSAYSIYIGSKVNSTGTVTVDGSGSELNNLTGGMWVGYSGTGTLNVTDGGKANSGGLGINIGRNATGIGTVTVDGNGSELNTNSSIGVGYDGTGVLTLTNGGKAVSILGIVLGENAGSSGTVSVDGTGSALTSNDQLIVGYQGEGELLLTGGGQAISASSIWLGYNAGSTGAVTVDGTGSLLESMGTSGMDGLYVGNSGTGTLEITGGGKATSAGGIYIGNQINSSGTVTVDGTGSLLESTGSILTVGNSGTGFLSLTDGGVVIADGNINIGYGSSGIGTVTIAGGSELKTKNFFQMLYVGYNGEGEL
ncbi:MAG: hypothetical protein FWC50_05145, partial [Planctomycetaceae bacterium]|nr:hypothetical protein [Planctomycetaceae bacterium]